MAMTTQYNSLLWAGIVAIAATVAGMFFQWLGTMVSTTHEFVEFNLVPAVILASIAFLVGIIYSYFYNDSMTKQMREKIALLAATFLAAVFTVGTWRIIEHPAKLGRLQIAKISRTKGKENTVTLLNEYTPTFYNKTQTDDVIALKNLTEEQRKQLTAEIMKIDQQALFKEIFSLALMWLLSAAIIYFCISLGNRLYFLLFRNRR